MGQAGCRAALFSLDGQLAALAQREWSHPPADGIPGSQSFDPAGNWALICACIREVLGRAASPAAVRAVGCSSTGGGLVLYDRAGHELWACANGDARAGQEAAVMLADGTAAELYRRGGGWISLSAAPRLAWVRRHRPDLWAAASRLSLIADWMVFRLTGTLATEASIGSTSGLFDLGRRIWSPELVTLGGLDPGWFPEVVEAGTVVGHVSALAFSQTGLAAGTPVVAGGLDTALGVAGPGQPVPGRLTVTGGSFWKQTVVAPARVVEPAGRLHTICHVRPGQWLVEGISWYAGFALRWLRDGAPAAGLGEQARAIQEAVAYTTRQASGLISELVGPGAGQQVTLTGGAARSRLWPQILADVLGCPVGVAEHTESAALGAAILAGRAAGVRLEDPPPGSRPAGTMRPSLAGQQAYARLHARWRSADQRS